MTLRYVRLDNFVYPNLGQGFILSWYKFLTAICLSDDIS